MAACTAEADRFNRGARLKLKTGSDMHPLMDKPQKKDVTTAVYLASYAGINRIRFYGFNLSFISEAPRQDISN